MRVPVIRERAPFGALTLESLTKAIDLVKDGRHDGWADIVVHQSQLRAAMKIAGQNNAGFPVLHVRVLTDTTLGHDEWRIATRSAVLTSGGA